LEADLGSKSTYWSKSEKQNFTELAGEIALDYFGKLKGS
jgi:hypothetical protein